VTLVSALLLRNLVHITFRPFRMERQGQVCSFITQPSSRDPNRSPSLFSICMCKTHTRTHT